MVKENHDFSNAVGAKPAYIYARFSSPNQRDGHSIERQLGYARLFAEQHSWVIVEELKDEGKSAYRGANREVGSALYEFELKAREGYFQNGVVLICENVDRLSRQGAKAAAKLIWSLNEAGVDVATYHDGHIYTAGDDADMMDLFSVIIKASVAHEESAKKSKRSVAGWTRIHGDIANGDKRAYSRQCPAWLKIEDGRYVVDEHRAAIVKQIFDWYVNGIGSLSIIRKLRAMKELSWSSEKRYKGTKEWTPRYLHKLLTSPAVMGEYITLKGEALATDYYPAVIDADTFYKAQAIRKARTTLGGDERKRSANLFSGISKCGCCGYGAVFQRRVHTNKKPAFPPRVHTYLRCNAARYKEDNCSNGVTIRYEVVEQVVLDRMLPLIASYKHENRVLSAFDVQIADHKRQLEVQQKQLDNIVEAIAQGIAAKALAQRADVIEAQIETLTAQIIEAKCQRGLEAAKPAKDQDVRAIERFRADINSDDEEIRFETRAQVNSHLSRLLAAIYINDDRTFTVDVDEGFSATFNAEGNAIGYRLNNKMIDEDMMRHILVEDRAAIVDAAFGKIAQ